MHVAPAGLAEALHEHVIAGEVAVKQLDRHWPIEPQVPTSPGGGVRTFTDGRIHAVPLGKNARLVVVRSLGHVVDPADKSATNLRS